jgi:NADH:ubiquinone oxidoreductase subunit F (NADH-binding)
MSKNLSSLSGKKGLSDNFFKRLVESASETGTPDESTYSELSRDYTVGEAIPYGTASFYDFLKEDNSGKKAYVCDGSACLCAGTQDKVIAELGKHFGAAEIGKMTCLGRCHENSAFYCSGRNYSGDDLANLPSIVKDGTGNGPEDYHVASMLESPVLTADFPGISAFYTFFKDVVLKKSPTDLLDEVKSSKLRGRGGAGFPAGMKWEACKSAPGDTKYIVCNADEGDPGAYIDRYLLEEQPHLVLFGMMVAGIIVGAEEGVLYIRAEYPESVDAIDQAIQELKEAGLLGTSIGGTSFNFNLYIVKGAGAYICGEETALLASMEGRRPEVSVRPPYPTTEGLFGKPTVVNNVESFANVRHILESGGGPFAETGTEESTGSKLLSLNGVFNRPGVYEIRMGTPLSVVIDELGQGFKEPVKALHIGGPLGGLVPREKFSDLTMDFESFHEHGFLLGHAGIIAIPETFPIIAYMEHLFEFCSFESCGKCFPCRIGAKRGQEMLAGALSGEHKLDRELLDDLIETMELGSLCAHGGGIPLPIKNALQYFKEELQPYFLPGGMS